MKRKTIFGLLVFVLLLTGCDRPGVFPGEDWQYAERPEDMDWSSEGLAEARAFSQRIGSAAVMIVHRGVVVDAWGDVERNYICHSMRKSLFSALFGIYVDEGTIDTSMTLEALNVDDRTPLTPAEKQATVADLLKARSGVYIPAAGEAQSMKDDRPERGSHAPNTFWYYNNWDFNALGTIFDQESGEENIYQAFKTRIADPIGMQEYPLKWLNYDYEPQSRHPYYGFLLSTRDLARFGLLFARDGRWEDQQIIPRSWVAESTKSYSDTGGGGYGYMWWVADKGQHLPNVSLPDGAFSARGYRGHYLLVIPQWDLVIVHRYDTFSPEGQVSDAEFGYLVRLILAAGPESMPSAVPGADQNQVLSEEQLRALAGRYALSDYLGPPEGFTPPDELTIEMFGRDLVILVPGEGLVILYPVGPTQLRSSTHDSLLLQVEWEGDEVERVKVELQEIIFMEYVPR
jgi:CubicO group peptidase (beta-lactamase class C family)